MKLFPSRRLEAEYLIELYLGSKEDDVAKKFKDRVRRLEKELEGVKIKRDIARALAERLILLLKSRGIDIGSLTETSQPQWT